MTKREAAVRLVGAVAELRCLDTFVENFSGTAIDRKLRDSVADFHAAPDDEEAGREERTEPRNEHLDSLLSGVHHGTIPGNLVIAAALVEIEHGLRALAAAVKERR